MNIANALKKLKTNLFGGPGNTGFPTPPPSKVQDIGITPTSVLDSDPLRFGTYQFPKDVFENQQLGHYMVFYVNQTDRSKYVYGNAGIGIGYNAELEDEFPEDRKTGVGLKSVNDRLNIKRNKTTGGNFSSKQSGAEDLSDPRRNSAALQGLGSVRKTTTRIKDSIALYLPANVVDRTEAEYKDTPTGILGVAAVDLIRLGRSGLGEDYEEMGKISGKVISDFAKETTKRFFGAAVEALSGDEGAVPLANKIFGSADNPFVEVFFNSMNVRTFTYNFNFAPRNEAETGEIQQIIQLFRFHMAPELQGTNSRYLTLPSEFDIHYMYKAEDGQGYENDYYNRIGTCVLTNVVTNYTPSDKVRSFADGAPTQVTMSLSFKETELLTKEKIKQGY